MTDNHAWQLLLVGADEQAYHLTSSILSQVQARAVELDWAPSYENGYIKISTTSYDAVLIDTDSDPVHGLGLIRKAAGQGYPAPFILTSGWTSSDTYIDAVEAGAVFGLPKMEATPRHLERAIGCAIERKKVENELKIANERLRECAERLAAGLAEQKHAEPDRLPAEQERKLAFERAPGDERFRMLFNNMSEGFATHEIITNQNGVPCDYRFLEVNPAFERITGLKRADLVGKRLLEVLPNDDPRWIDIYGRVALSGEPTRFENYSPALARWFEVFAYRPAAGQFAVIFMDITERKHAENEIRSANQALHSSELLLKRSQEIAHLGSWELDLVENRLFWSDEVYRIFGLEPQGFPATYEAFLEMIHPDDRAAVDAAYLGSIRDGFDSYEIEHRIVRRPGGEIRYVHEKCHHTRDASGNVVKSIGMVLDITERKWVEAALVRQNEQLKTYADRLERSNQALEDFAFIASHDLQEPLRKIQAFGDILKDRSSRGIDQENSEYIHRMQQAAARMQHMLIGLLAYSRISAQSQKNKSVDLQAAAADVLDDLELRIYQTGGQVEVGPLPVIQADPLQMRQLLQNLIGNALKFHRPDQPPKVVVSCSLVGENEIVLRVTDNGVGFPEKQSDRLFKPFHRLHTQQQYAGTGMGLAICRKIVERHAGSISARSMPGEGTTFTVTLPVRQKALVE